VYFSGATASPTDAILIDGEYEVATVVTVDSYTIVHSVTATNSESAFGGGSVAYSYELAIGTADSGLGGGFGAGAFDTGTWDTPRTGGSLKPARTWSIDSWGEDVIANPRGGGIYLFDTSGGIVTGNNLTTISGAPATAEFILVSPEDRVLIVLGAHDGSNSNPMLVRYSDSEDYTEFTASVTNTAGDQILDSGTKLVSGVVIERSILILSDSAAILMSPVGYPDGYGFKTVGTKCGAVSPGCLNERNGIAMWMGNGNFYAFNGTVQILDCDIWNYVFGDINTVQRDKVISGVNSDFNERWWAYPSADSMENNRIAVYDEMQRVWWYGENFDITAWLESEFYDDNPIAAAADGFLYDHEVGTDNDAIALPASVTSYQTEVKDGEDFVFLTKAIPDFKELVGSVNVTFTARDYPHSPERTVGPRTFTSATEKQNMRIRGRQVGVKIDSAASGVTWRMGALRVSGVTHGGRA
jgi:hypothetical protein